MTHRAAPSLSEIAAKPAFRTIDGLSIRFAESGPGNSDALLLSPWPESVFAYEAIWSRLVGKDPPGCHRPARGCTVQRIFLKDETTPQIDTEVLR